MRWRVSRAAHALVASDELADPSGGRVESCALNEGDAVKLQKVATWTKAKQLFDHLRSSSYVFRGHGSASWTLQTTLERLGSLDIAGDERLMLAYFKQRAMPLVPQGVTFDAAPVTTWLSLLQHYGGPTRLLDFTRSPYAAALFAMEKASTSSPYAIYAIRAGAAQLYAVEQMAAAWNIRRQDAERFVFAGQEGVLSLLIEKSIVGFDAVLPVEPLTFDLRQSSQQAVFMCPGTLLQSAEALVSAIPDGEGLWPNVVKLEIAAGVRNEAIPDLVAMNVTQASLFPGLDGLGRSAALQARFSSSERSALMMALTAPRFLSEAPVDTSDVEAIGRTATAAPDEAGNATGKRARKR